MKIIALMENTTISNDYENEHGLSVYVETKKHKILVDVGPNDKFIKNAEKIGVDLKEIDTVVISHAHDDHGGGLADFLKINSKAKIYVQKTIFDNYYVNDERSCEYIGLEQGLKNMPQFVFTEGKFIIDEELSLFSGICGNRLRSTANNTLMKKVDETLVLDDFAHEQCLVIAENDKLVLMGGCAHNGIVNIIDEFKNLYSTEPNYAISGFHLYNPSLEVSEEDELIENIAKELCKLETKFYTCHCTGQYPFGVLKNVLKDKIDYLSTGMIIEI